MTKKINFQSGENENQEDERTQSINPMIALTYFAQKNNFKGTEPTHNYSLLRESRNQKYLPALDKFKQERQFKELTTTGFDIACFYFMWLKAELNNCDTVWLSPVSNSDNIEVFKYRNWIQGEMITTEIKIQSFTDQVYHFRWKHSEDKAAVVYKGLVSKGFIDKKTTIETFKSVFGLLPVSQDQQSIVWILPSKGEPHKQALRDFLQIATGNDTIQYKTVEANFSDKNGNPIKLNKPNRSSKYYIEILDFFK